MKVVITAATTGEWQPAFDKIGNRYKTDQRFQLLFHCSGIGMLSSAVALTKLVYEEKPDLIIQAGIAGTFGTSKQIGKVFAINQEFLADTGVMENGIWKDVFDLKLVKSSVSPFKKRSLPNPFLTNYNLLKTPVVDAVTVNQVSTAASAIEQIQQKYQPALESMEGAALHYVGNLYKLPFLQIRAVSNVVGVRDKAQWKIAESISALNQTLVRYVDKAYKLL